MSSIVGINSICKSMRSSQCVTQVIIPSLSSFQLSHCTWPPETNEICRKRKQQKNPKKPKQGFPCDSDKACLPSALNCCIASHKLVLPVTSEVSTEIATKWFSGLPFILSDTLLESPALPFPASFFVSTVS